MSQHPNWHMMMEFKYQAMKDRSRMIAEHIKNKPDTRANIAEIFDLNDQTVTRTLKTFINLGFAEKTWESKVVIYKAKEGAEITGELIDNHLKEMQAYNRIHYENQLEAHGTRAKSKEPALTNEFNFVKYEATGVQTKQINSHTRLISVNKHTSKYGSDAERKAAKSAKTWAGIVDYGSM